MSELIFEKGERIFFRLKDHKNHPVFKKWRGAIVLRMLEDRMLIKTSKGSSLDLYPDHHEVKRFGGKM